MVTATPPGSADEAAAPTGTVGVPRWAVGRQPWFLVALHLPFVASGPIVAIPRHDVSPGVAAFVVVVSLAIGALQLRHSFAAARGERPAGWVWSLLALVVLVHVPLLWLGWDWSTMQWFVIASLAMLLPPAPALVAAVGLAVGQASLFGWEVLRTPGTGPGFATVATIYLFTLLVMGGGALYGSSRLVRVLEDLYSARTELAELAVGRERLRVSRDLHDLLGQSLSAVSLKGDLALRLLPTDAAAARNEIESLTGVARRALRDVRAVARDEHGVALPAELDAAAALLGAAGIATRVDVDLPGLAAPAEQVLAWAVREGATNTLRHSEATTWTVTGARQDGRVTLEIVNDGARTVVPDPTPASVTPAGRTATIAGPTGPAPEELPSPAGSLGPAPDELPGRAAPTGPAPDELPSPTGHAPDRPGTEAGPGAPDDVSTGRSTGSARPPAPAPDRPPGAFDRVAGPSGGTEDARPEPSRPTGNAPDGHGSATDPGTDGRPRPAGQPPDQAPGSGLPGLIARARAAGGTATAGPTPDGEDWHLRVTLPERGA
jgi:two-component system sensor histidine kinase DesK